MLPPASTSRSCGTVEDGFGPSALAADGQIVLEGVSEDPFFREGGVADGLDPVDRLDLDRVGGGAAG